MNTNELEDGKGADDRLGSRLYRKCTDCRNRMEMTSGGSSFCVEHSKKCSDMDAVICEYFYSKYEPHTLNRVVV